MSVDQNVPVQPGAANQTSALSLANAATLAIAVYQGIVGKNIADSINGSRLMQEQLATLACNKISQELINRHNTAKEMRLNGYN